jgi:hypothetical protein
LPLKTDRRGPAALFAGGREEADVFSSEGRSAVRTMSVLLLAALALAASARATTVEPLTFSEVVNGADVVAVGAVSAIAEDLDAEREMPLTEVSISVLEVLKGERWMDRN